MGRLEGKVALVTGAAGGMGAAASRLFAAEGARVALADVKDPAPVAAEIGREALAIGLDVGSERDWAGAVEQVERTFGRLDVLVNNAGVLLLRGIAETSLEDYERVVRVNQTGVFLGMRAALAPMARGGGGSIVNVSSVEGLRGMAGLVAYAATKFAVRGMTKVAAVEFGPRGIRVNAICPGGVDTPMTRLPGFEDADLSPVFRGIPLGRMGRAEEIARLALFLASDEASYCTGSEFVADGGATSYIHWAGASPLRIDG